MTRIIINRSQAVQSGVMRYYTGKPCTNGHIAERYTVSGACLECLSDRTKNVRERIKSVRAALAAEGTCNR